MQTRLQTQSHVSILLKLGFYLHNNKSNIHYSLTISTKYKPFEKFKAFNYSKI